MIIVLFLVFQLLPANIQVAQVATQKPENAVAASEVDAIVRKLWTANMRERQAAKQQLIEIGAPAVGPILSLLNDLVINLSPRFPNAKAQQGLDLVVRYTRSASDEESTTLANDISKLAINGQLKDDCIELLGRLKAVEAVPVLIRIMGGRGSIVSRMTIGAGPEMSALESIGRPALPMLIEALKEPQKLAPTIVSEVAFVLEGRPFRGSAAGHVESSRGRRHTGLDLSKWYLERAETQLRSASALVIGHIGDPSALPVLESLAKKYRRDKQTLGYLKQAIAMIRKKAAKERSAR